MKNISVTEYFWKIKKFNQKILTKRKKYIYRKMPFNFFNLKCLKYCFIQGYLKSDISQFHMPLEWNL